MARSRSISCPAIATTDHSTRRTFLARAATMLSGAALASRLTGRVLAAPGASIPRYRVQQLDDKTLVIADSLPGGLWIGLDPAWYYEPDPSMAMYVLYDQLYHAPDGANPMRIEPLLAEDLPTFSDDLLTATIPIRRGIEFHHTRNQMTADDVIFSFDRLAATRAQPSFLATDYWTEIRKIDDYTIQLTLPSPNAGLAALLASLQLSITDSKQVMAFGGTTQQPGSDTNDQADPHILANRDAQNRITQTSVGTGPFMVEEWDTNSAVVLVANPYFWGEAPQIERIIFSNVLEANAQLQAVETGEADIAFALDPNSVDAVRANPQLQLLEGASLSIQYMAMNLQPERGGPLADRRVRQAIAYAIDYDAIIENLLAGGALRPALPIPLPFPGSEAMLEKAYVYDPERAQALWNEADAGEQEISINYESDGPGEGGVDLGALATVVKANLEMIDGLHIALNPLPGVQRTETYRAGDFQMTFAHWTPDFPDVDAYAAPFFRTDTAVAKRVGYSNPEVDALLQQGLEAIDPAERESIYLRVQEFVLPDIPYIVFYQPIYRKPANLSVQGVTAHPVYMLDLRNAGKRESNE